jgi:hypothetical protein
VGLEPKISSGEGPQIHALDRAATGIGNFEKKNTIKNRSIDFN